MAISIISSLWCNSRAFPACLNNWSLQNITTAKFADCQSATGIIRVDSIANRLGFSKLKHLDVSNTELDQTTFELLCRELKSIKTLNISNTFVKDLEPLMQFRSSLTSLYLTVRNKIVRQSINGLLGNIFFSACISHALNTSKENCRFLLGCDQRRPIQNE